MSADVSGLIALASSTIPSKLTPPTLGPLRGPRQRRANRKNKRRCGPEARQVVGRVNRMLRVAHVASFGRLRQTGGRGGARLSLTRPTRTGVHGPRHRAGMEDGQKDYAAISSSCLSAGPEMRRCERAPNESRRDVGPSPPVAGIKCEPQQCTNQSPKGMASAVLPGSACVGRPGKRTASATPILHTT